MLTSRRLILAHFWLAFCVFGLALLLGAWQMIVRTPLYGWISNPDWYYRSVTAHGTAMAYVFPTLIAMGFGYAISEAALKQKLVGRRWAWLGFTLIAIGSVTALVPVALGRASVLYTFYPPLIGNAFYYIGVVLVVVGSWIWVALMSINLHVWKQANPDTPVPLAMFANVAGSYLWAWTAIGASLELLLQIIPVSLGLKSYDRCGTCAGILLMDAARDRLFLADPDLYRLLRDRAARHRRQDLQRYDGAHRLRPLPRGVDADRLASHIRGSASRRGL